jgi:hypothetical protein
MRQRTDRTAAAAAAPRAHQARGAAVAPPSIPAVLAEPGVPLPPQLQSQASRYLGFDVSSARVHAGLAAAESAREVAARAYTVRPHLVFAHGKYEPDTARGQALLLHELGHFHQQAEHDPRAPLHVGRSHAHEANADLLARRMAAPLAMQRNHLACNAEVDPAPDGSSLAELRAAAGAPAATVVSAPSPAASPPPGPSLPARPHGTLYAGVTYARNFDGNYEVHFPASANGRRVIDDVDDPTKPTVVNLSSGERSTQLESKKLTVHGAEARATYKPENMLFNPRGEPVGIRKFKPIAVSVDLSLGGYVRQIDTLRGATGEAHPTDPNAITTPNVVRAQSRDRTITGGNFDFSKAPRAIGDLKFEKFEDASVRGATIVDVTDASIHDRQTGLSSSSRTNQTTVGDASAGRGRATDGPYVLRNSLTGTQNLRVNKEEVTPLRSGREIVVTSADVKDGRYSANTKALENYGSEVQPDRQSENKDKQGREVSNKANTAVKIFRPKEVTLQTDQGPLKAKVLVPVSSTRVLFSRVGQIGRSSQIVGEDREKAGGKPSAAKTDLTGTAGAAGAIQASYDRGTGLYALNLSTSAGLGLAGNLRSGVGPDVAASAARPQAGQTDLVNVQIASGGDKASGNGRSATFAATDMGATVSGEASKSSGYRTYVETPKPERLARSWSYFSIDTIYSGTELAGYHLEGKLQGQAQRGTRGALLKGGQLSAAASTSFQLGNLSERGVEFIVRPDLKKATDPTIRFLLETIDPVLDLKLKAHTFNGIEVKVDGGASYSPDSGASVNAGASITAGARIGFDIDGSIQVGKPLGDVDPQKGFPRAAQGARIGSIRGSFAGVLGAAAAWRTTYSWVGGRVIAGGEGSFSFPLGASGSLRAEADFWKLGSVGVAFLRGTETGRKVAAWWRSDVEAVQQVQAGAHASLDLTQRAVLLDTLLTGHTNEAEQAAIVRVLADARRRFDFFQLVGKVGNNRLWLALDGQYNQQYQALRQTP